jgi:hypothetical protein
MYAAGCAFIFWRLPVYASLLLCEAGRVTLLGLGNTLPILVKSISGCRRVAVMNLQAASHWRMKMGAARPKTMRCGTDMYRVEWHTVCAGLSALSM